MGRTVTPERFRSLMTVLYRARTAKAPSALARLRAFLTKARPLLVQAAPRSPLPERALTAERLRDIMLPIRPRLAHARTAGDRLNVWAVAGLRRNEVRNAAVLAWFMDPFATHGLGTAVIRAVLSCGTVHRGSTPFDLDADRVRVHTELRPQGSSTDRVDIALETREHVLFIEVKIDAGEGPEQLARYAAAAAAMHKDWRLIFLSPAAPRSPPAGAAWLTWRDLVAALRGAADALPASPGRSLLYQFAAHARAFK